MEKPEDGDSYDWEVFDKCFKRMRTHIDGKQEDYWHFWKLGYTISFKQRI